MRKLALTLLGLAIVASSAPAMPKTDTVTGQLVDLYCYNPETKENAGMDHRQGRECAAACAKWEGQPVGLVAPDGKLYQLAGELVANNNAKVAPHITHTVTITGDVVEKAGILTLTASDLKMVSK
jgi:hypothetical protein